MADKTAIPLDVHEIDSVQYQLIGFQIQQTACSQMYWAAHRHVVDQRKTALIEGVIPSIDDWNAEIDELRGLECKEQQFVNEHATQEFPENVVSPIENAARWKHVWQCTIARNTTHWIHKYQAAYMVADAFKWAIERAVDDSPSDKLLAKHAKATGEATEANIGQTLYEKQKARRSNRIAKYMQLGKEACVLCANLTPVETQPIDWEFQWVNYIKPGAAKSIAGDYNKSVEEIANDLVIAFPSSS